MTDNEIKKLIEERAEYRFAFWALVFIEFFFTILKYITQ